MKRCDIFYCSLFVLMILVGFGGGPKQVRVPDSLRVTEPIVVDHPKKQAVFTPVFVAPPFLGTSYIGFKEALAFKESRGDYFTINALGYMGKYQFGHGTLELLGVNNTRDFLFDPELQEKAFYTNLSRNKWILRKDLKRFVGKRIAGVHVTESGVLAAAHLAGPGNVKKFLRSYGAKDVSDEFGTSIMEYMRKFSGYDVSHIPSVRNPRI
ncbi:MAG: hypothetical protein AB3N16_02550 [Flavobacteriaceae bacterium]